MKSKNILNIFLLISLLSGLFVFQPADVVQALPADQAQRNLTGLIAYISQDGNIRLINSDGSNEQQLTSDGGYNGLTWSPNGLNLALTKGSDKPQSLFIKDLTNKPAQKLSDNVYAFAWDLSGNRIAYSTDQIHIYNVKNNIEEKIIPKDSPGGKYTPSKFGLEFLFWNFWGDNLIYYSEGIQGIHQVNISTLEDTLLFSPNASDHLGELIIQLQYDPFSGYFFGWDYSSQNLHGTPLLISPSRELKILDEFGLNLIWDSPTTANWFSDGKRLVYGIAEDYLFSIDTDTNPITAKPLNESGMNPRWSPDGKMISFTTRKGGLKLFNVDEPKVTSLLDDVPVSDEAKYLTQGCALDSCYYTAAEENASKWSPDGKNIILPFKIGFFIYNLESKKSDWVDGGISPEWQPVKKYTIKDLTVQPDKYINSDTNKNSDEKKQEGIPVILKWNNPNELVYRTVDAYEIRFAEFPITDDTWQKGKELKPAPSVTADLSKGWRTHIPEISKGKDLYFGIKFHTADGWSPVSNIVKYIDLGFRPNLDGYMFSNSDKKWGEYPLGKTVQDFTVDDLHKMFGDSVCDEIAILAGVCILQPLARLWLVWANETTLAGHCLGMATSSLLIYKEPQKIKNISSASDVVFSKDINLDSLKTRKYITYYFMEQWALPYLEFKSYEKDKTPSYVLEKIRSGIIGGDFQLLNMELKTLDNDPSKYKGWHTVTPLAILDNDSGLSSLFVYDNIFPSQITRIIIDRNSEKWSYASYGGSGLLPGIYNVPLSILAAPQEFPLGKYSIVSMNMPVGSSFITDSLGDQLGIVDGNLENEIQDGNLVPFLDGDGGASGLTYVLPIQDQYTMHVISQKETSATNIAFWGSGSGIILDNVVFPKDKEDLLTFKEKNYEFSYKSFQDQDLSIRYAVESGDSGYLFSFSSMGLDSGRELVLKSDLSNQQLILLPASNNSFDLNIVKMNSSGDVNFSHNDVQFLDAKVVSFDVGNWNGYGAISAYIDYDGDGKYDEVAKISNQESFIGSMISYKYSGFLFCGAGFALFLIGALGLIFVRRKAS